MSVQGQNATSGAAHPGRYRNHDEVARLRRLNGGTHCRCSEIRDIRFFSSLPWGARQCYPFAALFGSLEEIPSSSHFALTLFPRYGGMDVVTNILNRPLVVAIKGEEKGAVTFLNPDCEAVPWERFINEDRAKSIGRKCH
jgi:hypothetical protein